MAGHNGRLFRSCGVVTTRRDDDNRVLITGKTGQKPGTVTVEQNPDIS